MVNYAIQNSRSHKTIFSQCSIITNHSLIIFLQEIYFKGSLAESRPTHHIIIRHVAFYNKKAHFELALSTTRKNIIKVSTNEMSRGNRKF